MENKKIYIFLFCVLVLLLGGCSANKMSNPNGFMLNPPRDLKVKGNRGSDTMTLTWKAPKPTSASFEKYEVYNDGVLYMVTMTNDLTTQNNGGFTVVAVYKEGKSVPSNGSNR